jgi:hypothetical protein
MLFKECHKLINEMAQDASSVVTDSLRAIQESQMRMETQLSRLQEETASLRASVLTLHGRNGPVFKPAMLFEEWYQSMTVNDTILRCVFDFGLVYGMRSWLESECIKYANAEYLLPLSIHQQKKDVFFVFQDGWRKSISEDMEKMFIRCKQSILKYYVEWKKREANMHLTPQQELDYMMKVMGNDIAISRQYLDLKRSLMETLRKYIK